MMSGSLSDVTPFLESRSAAILETKKIDGGEEQHTNAVLELTIAIIRESPPPNQRELPQVCSEVPDAHPIRRVAPLVTRWTSADRVVTSSVDIDPSATNRNFKFVTKFRNLP
jgi:hypothetical protein